MKFDVVVIGGGIVGLASALKIKESNPSIKVALVEKEDGLAKHQTGNNSGVMHSGIYYKPGSLKATNCINGYKQLISFCDEHSIPYELCGKLIVATEKEELPRLEALYQRGLENGLDKIKKVAGGAIQEYEPHSKGLEAIHLPYTGIVDYRKVCEVYAQLFTEKYQGSIFLSQKVSDIRLRTIGGGAEVVTNDYVFEAKLVINTAGLFSDKIAAINERSLGVKIIPFRGEYLLIRPEKHYLVKNLIYPVPDPAFPFLGVHFTRMMRGGIEAGPNAVFAFKREGYKKSDVSLSDTFEALTWPGFQKVMFKYWKTGLGEFWRSYNKAAMVRALQRLLPEITAADLAAGGAGVRAQACDKHGGLIDDFLFAEDRNLLNILNAPSPAATASLSIGTTIAAKALQRL